jgi:DNA topoisomerase III
MKVAEKLYTSGFISYPRTETDQFDPGMNLRALVEKQVGDAHWGNYAQGYPKIPCFPANFSLLNGRYHAPRNGRNNDKAHPPIHPVAHATADALRTAEDRKVYEFVVRRFLACCSDDARGQATTVDLDLSGERFSVTGLVVIERNYLDVYPYDKWTSSQPLPQFIQGEMVMPTSLEMVEGKTSSPQYLTEPELIALMDVNGIGTDATIADHIEKIVSRMYVFRQPKTRRAGGNDNEDGEEEDDEDLGRGRGRGRGRGEARGRGGRGRGRGGAARGGGGGGGGAVEFVPSNLGIGLVEGYDSMHFDISLIKPFLRKEVDLVAMNANDRWKRR